MTASLYQRASSPAVARVGSGEAVEAGSGRRAPVYTDAVGRKRMRAQLDVVVRALPQVAPAAEQVLDEELLAGGDIQLVQRQLDPARLDVVRVEVYYNDN